MPPVTHIQNEGTETKEREEVFHFQTLRENLCSVPKVKHLILCLESLLVEVLD